MIDYAEMLVQAVGGRPAVAAIRALEAGDDPRATWMLYQEATLPPALAEAMRLARADGTVSSASLRALHPSASSPTLSNRLAELERLGLLVQVRQETIKRGGRRLVYAPWDAQRCKDCGAVEGEADKWEEYPGRVHIAGNGLCSDCYDALVYCWEH